MSKHFPAWPDWDEQVPIYDLRGLDVDTIETVGFGYFTRIMPRADLIALKPGELLVVEFDRAVNPMHVITLTRYIDAVRHDHLRPDWRKRKLKGAFVIPEAESRVKAECERLGYMYVVEPEPVP